MTFLINIDQNTGITMRIDFKGIEYGGRDITFTQAKFIDMDPISRGFIGEELKYSACLVRA